MSEHLANSSPNASPNANPNANPAEQATPLARALDQNESAMTAVEQSATELVVINTVLKQEIPDHLQTGDVAQALQKTDALEAKINDAAHDLAQVNNVLAQEIDERVDLEQELADTKAALAQALGSSS